MRARCKACVLFVSKLVIVYCVGCFCNIRSMWNWTYEPVGFRCNREPLPVNNSGLKVLAYAMAKTGTTTITRTLLEFYRNVYHSEDWTQHIWVPMVDEYYQQPENGGGMFPWQRLASAAAPARMCGSFREGLCPAAPLEGFENSPDLRVQRNTPRFREEVARRLSMCGAEVLAFDGMENLFWDVYAVSPEAKVIMLNWRKYEDWGRSLDAFLLFQILQMALIALVNTGMHMLPYNALVLPIWDALTGNTLSHSMGNGTKSMRSFGSKYLLFRQSFMERRFVHRFNSGLGGAYPTRAHWEEFWAEGKRRIPKERLLEFNVKKGTMRELCDFLEIKDDPRCDSGRLPKYSEIFAEHENQRPQEFFALFPYFFFCHWFNYTVVCLLLARLGIVPAMLLKVFPKRKREQTLS